MPSELLSNFERQQRIIHFLNIKQRISVLEICEMFSISEATARRDLEVLTEQHYVRRVHGGAVLLSQAPPEFPMVQRVCTQAEEKRNIRKAAARLIPNGQTVFLGSGTTVLEVAKGLQNHQGLTVVTNSSPVLNMLSGNMAISVIALGGFLRESELSSIC